MMTSKSLTTILFVVLIALFTLVAAVPLQGRDAAIHSNDTGCLHLGTTTPAHHVSHPLRTEDPTSTKLKWQTKRDEFIVTKLLTVEHSHPWRPTHPTPSTAEHTHPLRPLRPTTAVEKRDDTATHTTTLAPVGTFPVNSQSFFGEASTDLLTDGQPILSFTVNGGRTVIVTGDAIIPDATWHVTNDGFRAVRPTHFSITGSKLPFPSAPTATHSVSSPTSCTDEVNTSTASDYQTWIETPLVSSVVTKGPPPLRSTLIVSPSSSMVVTKGPPPVHSTKASFTTIISPIQTSNFSFPSRPPPIHTLVQRAGDVQGNPSLDALHPTCTITRLLPKSYDLNPTSKVYSVTITHTDYVQCHGCALSTQHLAPRPVVHHTTTTTILGNKTVMALDCAPTSVPVST